ncbi:MAG: hypothetical protein IJ748_06700 [Bacteroidales bacterium]|nr:hypothetical protein [Bacteroidales bacterium]
MGIRYRKTRRKVNYNGEVRQQYSAKIISSGTLTLRDIAKRVAFQSTMSVPEFEMAVSLLAGQVKEQLANGFTLDLGDLGRFKPCFTSKACDNLSDINNKSISNVRVNYKAGKEIAQKLRETSLESVRDIDEYGRKLNYAHSSSPKTDGIYDEDSSEQEE